MDSTETPSKEASPLRIPIKLSGTDGIRYRNTPVSLGIPFAESAVSSLDNLTLTDNGEPLAHQLTQTACWPDGSIRWALLEFHASMSIPPRNAMDEKTVYLCTTQTTDPGAHNAQPKGIYLPGNNDDDELLISTGQFDYTLNRKTISSIGLRNQRDGRKDRHYKLLLKLIDTNDNIVLASTESCEILSADNSQSTNVRYCGYFHIKEQKSSIKFELTVTFFAKNSAIKFTLCISNEQAAKHSKGLWDLGDEGSIYFKHLSLEFLDPGNNAPASIVWKTTAKQQWENDACNHLSIYQESSAGKNWRSAVHKNHLGEVPMQIRGAIVQSDSNRSLREERLCPHIFITGENAEPGISLYINNFWQNFPTALEVGQQGFSIQFFPEWFPDKFELQGGEQKTQEAFVDLLSNQDSLDWVEYPLQATLSREYYASTNAILYLSDSDSELNHSLLDLVQAGIEGPANFFAKREVIDEYGWRNFGELYADHENLEFPGTGEVISHYNNQYDAISGFAFQYIISGDRRWFSLMDELARHVYDIDIYHTKLDRSEYNGGLFWHTDHYLDASTCTHRSFSIDHAPEVYMDYQKGGGPGEEHCYTTGLMYHFFLTGNPKSKEAVISLASWITRVYESSGELLDTLFRFKKNKLPVLARLLKRQKVAKYSYPLTRGTGNYINALIDCFWITSNEKNLSAVDNIIRSTVHPGDDLNARDLHNIEYTWSYTIFLQAVGRFLETKETLDERDDAFWYARDCLLTYARWIAEHELPYLEQHEVLEWPNHTWVAQELRKAWILFLAAKYSDRDNAEFLERARFFHRYACEKLDENEQKQYTRILVILMQNQGIDSWFERRRTAGSYAGSPVSSYGPPPQYSISGLLCEAIIDCFKALRRLNPRSEYLWLQRRLKGR